LANEVQAHLLWVTRTYGFALTDEILSAQPGATIWNTEELGKPDMVKPAYALHLTCGAEAVICISNKPDGGVHLSPLFIKRRTRCVRDLLVRMGRWPFPLRWWAVT
jgi:hypothetical protein